MYKPINKLTKKDKLKILAAYRNYAIRNYGMEWDEWANHVIQKEIDIIFDDKNLNQRSTQLPAQLSTQPSSQLSSQLSSIEYIRALEAREYFKWSEKHEKPNVLDFLIWRDMKRADGTDGADNGHGGTNSADDTDNSVGSNGMVYVPSKMPVRTELKQSKTETLAKAEKSEKAGKTAKTAKTAKTTKKASSRRKHSQKLDMMNRMLDKLFNAYIETDDGSLLPIHVPDEYFDEDGNVRQNEYLNYMRNYTRSHMRTEMLRNNLRKATRAIQTHLNPKNPTNPANPTDFCKHPDFLALIDMAENMNGAFRLTVSFPASFLKNRENKEKTGITASSCDNRKSSKNNGGNWQ